jgi:Predicted hydrolases of the HAD superfamily
MFEISDEKYAVSNANELLKKLATDIIGSNDEDGVALFLKERYKFEEGQAIGIVGK